ncbi:unnamed protein product [Protopolystoma xenopodis]|uniref:Uncharacterized protein n=1 Tax=Protopolystoma xenopodis TaxID=117903 RepID=A0A448XKF6_9PLAT|nr:unnamed protein product [Protopolystoma xenopodis]
MSLLLQPQSGQAYSASPSSCSAYNNRVFSTMTNHPHPAPDMSLQNSGCISGVGAVGTLIDEVSCAEATHHSHQSGPRESPASTSPSLHGSSPYMPTAQLPFSASWWSSGPTMTAASGDMEASIEAASGLGTATLNGASVSSIITMNNNVSNNSNNEDYNEVDVSSFGANGQPSSHFPESLEAEEKAVRREARDKRRQEREKRRKEKHLARQQLQNQRDNLHNPSYQTSGNLISRVESQQMLIASNASVPENDYSQVPAGHVESPQSTGNSLHSRSGFLQLGLLSDVVAYEEDFGDAGSPLSPHLAGPLGDKREQRKKVISEKHDRDEVVNEGGGGQKERAFQQAEQLKYANIEMNDSGELRRQERHERRERRRQQRELLKRQKASLNCITQASIIFSDSG